VLGGSVMCDLVGCWQDVEQSRAKLGKSETENDLSYP
jgi:hypothetical protein